MILTRRRRIQVLLLVLAPVWAMHLVTGLRVKAQAMTFTGGTGSSKVYLGRHAYLVVDDSNIVMKRLDTAHQSILEFAWRWPLGLYAPGPGNQSTFTWNASGVLRTLAETLLLALLSALGWYEWVRVLRPAGRCEACGHDLRRAASGPCVECGATHDADWHRRERANAGILRRANLAAVRFSRRHRFAEICMLAGFAFLAISLYLWMPRPVNFTGGVTTNPDGTSTSTATRSRQVGALAFYTTDRTWTGPGNTIDASDPGAGRGDPTFTTSLDVPRLGLTAAIWLLVLVAMVFGLLRTRGQLAVVGRCYGCGCRVDDFDGPACPACDEPLPT